MPRAGESFPPTRAIYVRPAAMPLSGNPYNGEHEAESAYPLIFTNVGQASNDQPNQFGLTLRFCLLKDPLQVRPGS